MPIVGSTPVQVTAGPAVLIQNLGPDDLYVGRSTVTSTDGIRVSGGESVAAGFVNGPRYVVSAGSSDVRLLDNGTGIFPA